jgi:hypothetical protein
MARRCPLTLSNNGLRAQHIGATRRHEVGRAFWATLTERQRPNGCDRRRVLGHNPAPNSSMSGTTERRWMEPGACNCAPAGERPGLSTGLGWDDKRCWYRRLMCEAGNSLAREDIR